MKIVIRLPIPEGRPGEVVDVSEHRAHALVGSNYARYAEGETGIGIDAEPAGESNLATPDPVEREGVEVEPPSVDDLKDDWVKAAKSLGINTTGKTKAELIDLVRNATG